MKYPKTLYWPTSPGHDKLRNVAPDYYVDNFINTDIVITEKLDGSNILLYNGDIYARSVSAPASYPWLAMLRKHHAWKLINNDTDMFYGEDIYGVHSITYPPVAEDQTYYVFALKRGNFFLPWSHVVAESESYGFATVPQLFRGTINSKKKLDQLLHTYMSQESMLDPNGNTPKEGLVIRLARAIRTEEFQRSVLKLVRKDHVQPDSVHWRTNWHPCSIITT